MGLKKTLILFLVSIVCFVHHSVAREVTCTGIVIDAQDEPIAGVKVTLYEIENNRATYSDNLKVTGETVTDTDGKFSLSCSVENQKHRYGYIVAQKEGLALGFDNWRIRDGNKKLEIRLGEGEEVTGIVVDEDGNPIPDAKVSIALMTVGGGKERRVLNGVVTKEFFAAQTDKDGKFIFNDIPTEAKVGFTVKKTGRAAISTYQRTKIPPFRTLKCYSSRDDIKLVMSVEARLEGIVVEKNTGRPIAGVRMLVGDDPRYIFLRHKLLVSGEDGTFSIGALTPERYVVQLDEFFGGTQDWVAEPVEVIAEAGEIKSGLKLELCKGGILEIVATDASYKKPVENANVDVMRQNENPVLVDTHTNEEGIARVRLLPGEYRGIRIFKEGYSNYQQRESFTIEEGRTKRIELQLTRLPGITGTVKDENGKPVEGATLQVCPMGKDSTTSGAEGKFEVDWDLAGWNSSGCPLMYLVGRYDKDNLAAAVVIKEDTGAIDLQLEPGVTLTGKIVDPNGKGIADSQITVMFQTQDWMTAMGQDIAQIDAEGNVKVRAIPAGYKYGIYARANGYGEDFIEVDTEDAVDNRFDGIKLTLNVANLSVSGIVVDMDDKPVTGANVSCYRDNQFSLIHRRVKTDINGKFTIDKICSGRVSITANVDGRTRLYGSIETEGGAKDVKIVVKERTLSPPMASKRPPSLIRRPLQELKEFKIELPPAGADDAKILVCFWDMEQRPSRRCILELARQAEQLRKDGIIVVAVQASKVSEDILNDWIEKNEIFFPVGMIENDEEKTRFTWGVRSLPWLILTDKEHIVAAEGFNLAELDEKISNISKN